MIVIDISNGLGNQMFQYALAVKMMHMGRKVFLNTASFADDAYGRHFELEKVFGIEKSNIGLRNCIPYGIAKLNTIKDRYIEFMPEVLEKRIAHLSGYWQNEAYFSDIRDEILNIFSFDETKLGKNNIFLSNEMQKTNSISIHVRRGDYLNTETRVLYGNICTDDYYKKAIKMMDEKISNPVYYIFSDDVEWCKLHFADANVVFIDENRGDNAYMDMYLMSQCKYHIIANSSFSWWGAWLGRNSDKIVIAPNKWINTIKSNDIICNNWIKIEN